jgi:hypothetical protein
MSFTIDFLLLIILVVIPGLLFKRFYFQGEFSKQFSTKDSVYKSVFYSIIPGVLIQLIGYLIYVGVRKHDFTNNDLICVFKELFGSSDNYSNITNEFVEKGISNFILHDLFLEEISKLPFGLPTAMQLSKKFGSSVHSALRNYVIQTKNRCALLVLTPIRGAKGNGAVCEIRNMFYSSPFINEFGKIKLPKEFGYTWEFIKDYRHKKRYKENGVIEIITEEGEIVNASYHFFNNSYNVFVFLFPKGEHKKSKVNLILQNIN